MTGARIISKSFETKARDEVAGSIPIALRRQGHMTPQIIEIQPFRFGWQVRGATAAPTPPFFTGSSAFEHAIAYAQERARRGVGEIRILARTGEVIMKMPFGTQQRYVFHR